MASDINDLAFIQDEDLLRRMWQQTEDFGLKKEIRTHMYKVREERLRDFYSTGNMDTSGFGPAKTPLTPSHGESLADQSFQSLKTKEIRDSESPGHEFIIARSGIVPDTSGWNIVTSSEVSQDGRARKTESLATTEASKLSHPSSERPSRPDQSNREPIYDTPKSPPRDISPRRPAGKPSNFTESTTRVTKTIKVDDGIYRDTKPSKDRKVPKGHQPASDDEGFEPESPRSSSPTSSVSDLVYQKCPEDRPSNYDTVTTTTTRRQNVTTDEFINREQKEVEINRTSKTSPFDDSTFERKKYEKDLPERKPKSSEEVPRDDGDYIVVEDHYTRRTPQRSSPRDESDRHYPSDTIQKTSPYESPDDDSPRDRRPADHKSAPKREPRYPDEQTSIDRKTRPPFDHQSSPKRELDYPADQTPDDRRTSPYDSPEYDNPSDVSPSGYESNPRKPNKHRLSPFHSPERDYPYVRKSGPSEEIDYPSDTTPTNRRASPYQSPERDYPTDRIFPRDRSPKSDFVESGSDREPREPFYLIEPEQPGDKVGKKPKLTRSETYEERCRQILGMDRTTNEDFEETVTRRRSSQRDTVDFIRREQEVEKRTKPSRDSVSPQQMKSPKPTRETSETEYLYTQKTTKEKTEHERSNIPRKSSPEKLSPEGSPIRKRTPQDSPRNSPRKVSPVRKSDSVPGKKQPTRQSPDSSPTRKIPDKQSPQKLQKGPTKEQSPERGSPRKPTETSRTKQSPDRCAIYKPTERDSPEVSPSRRLPSKHTTSRSTEKKSLEISLYRRSPESHTSRRPSDRGSPEVSPSRHSPRSPTNRKPTERSSPEISPSRRSPGSHTNRKPTERSSPEISPSRRSPGSPTNRKPTERSSPEISPDRRSPGSRKSEKPNERDSPVVSQLRRSTNRPATQGPGEIISPDSSPSRRSPGKHSSRKPLDSPEVSPIRHSANKPRKPAERNSPEVSPSRKQPSTRQITISPTREPKTKSITKPKTFSGDTSPSRRERSPAKVTETITITTHRTTKDAPISRSPEDTSERPRRPSHVTTAKIHLSLVDDAKPSSSDTKKSPKKSQTKTTSGVHPSTIVTSAIRESSTRTSKSTVSRELSPQRITEKQTTGKHKTTEILKHKDNVYVDESKPEEEEETTEEDSDMISDTEDITTVIEATTIRTKDKKRPLTDRKDSAPVYRTTQVDKEKMTRSTSENIIKTTNRRPATESEGSPERVESPRKKSLDKKRPVKCMATKTINLTTTNNIINSQDMDDVIIDIQLAKSSREPSPNRLVPTPVRNDEDMGNLRYPDRVQEPEDETRRRPKIKDIPIFEEDTNEYVRCHISEVEEHSTTTTKHTSLKTSRESSPIKDRPHSPSSEPDDDFRLSVHDKVNKFTTTAEEIKKPKTSRPFQREPQLEDVSEPDDCLLSVNDKVSKFTTTVENITKSTKPGSTSKRPERPSLEDINDELLNDECILSVSQKVDKFTDSVPQKSPGLVAKIERQISRKDDLSDEPILEPEEKKPSPKANVKDRYNPEKMKPTNKPLSTKAVLLQSTDVVKKVKSVFENGDVSKPRQKDILSRPSVWETKRKPEVKLEDIGVHKPFDDETEDIINRQRSRSRSPGGVELEPELEPEFRIAKTKTHRISTTDTVSSRKSLFENNVKTTRQSSQDSITTKRRPTDVKPIKPTIEKMSPKFGPKDAVPTKRETSRPINNDGELIEEYTRTTTTRRTEQTSPTKLPDYAPKNLSPKHRYPDEHTSKRPKEEFLPERKESTKRISDRYIEKIQTTQKPASDRIKPTTHRPNDDFPSKTSGVTTRTPNSRPSYMEPTVSSLEHRRDSAEYTKTSSHHETIHNEETLSSTEPVPSYMEHTISSIEHRRDSIEVNKTNSRRTSHDSLLNAPELQPRSNKFGVELKRTDSQEGRPRRKSSSSDVPHIEEIFDLELLEKMLETVVGYEQRRRIRTQIRIVKKLIEEQDEVTTTKTTTTTKVTRKGSASPIRKTETHVTRRVETSPERQALSARKPSHPTSSNIRSSSNRFVETESRHITQHEKKSEVHERSISPQSKIFKTITSTTTTSQNRKVNDKPTVKKPVSQHQDKPIWATKNILKKPNDQQDQRTTVKKTSTTKSQRQVITRDDDADCITSSYGIGPTDDDGKPLFGIRALKKKPTQPGETSKVTGSIVTEHYYSENGAPPVGERKVTVYSTNPEDLNEYDDLVNRKYRNEMGTEELTSRRGVTSVTRVQKVGNKKDVKLSDLSSLTDGETTSSTQETKTVRRGSVKEMSEKFIRKESSSSVTEKTSSGSYPKAGLILRTQHYSSTDNEAPEDEGNVEIFTTRKQSRVMTESDSETDSRRTTKSFLNSDGEKVTGVNDVLDRMRNADSVVEEGDSAEDIEARSLLNKFLGASVLMSGVEAMIPKEVVTRTVVESPGKREVKTTRVTKTITTGSSSPVTRKTRDIEEIWDEEYLKQLLEQTTNYEERRKIRARIRQIMAEKEACKEIVASVKAELQKEQHEKSGKKDSAKGTTAEATNDDSETESEYEEVEYVEEVTDDSAEGEDVEDNDDDEEEEVEEEVDEEKEDENDSKGTKKEPKPDESKKVPEKSVEVKTAPKQVEKQKSTEKVEEKKPILKTVKEVEVSKTDKERGAVEQSKLIILPLLQGLLQKNIQSGVSNNKSNNSTSNSNSSRKSSSGTNLTTERDKKSIESQSGSNGNEMNPKRGDRSSLVVHHVEDSGTESGEDLKFIAAGLRDSLQIHSIENQSDNELITEVTNALNRLETSLREGKDLKLDAKKRNALLTLVARLQTGLTSPEKITAPTPAPGQMADGDNELSSPDGDNRRYPRPGHQRFAKRRNRANRHTVGVSREELADARRYIEEMVMMETLSNCTTPDSGNVISPPEYPIQKQNSSGAVLGNDVQEPSTLFRPNQFVPTHLKDDTADQQQSVQMREKKLKSLETRQSLYAKPSEPADDVTRRRYSDAYSPETNPTTNNMVQEKNVYNRIHHSSQPVIYGPVFSGMRPSAYQPTEQSSTPVVNVAETNKSSRFVNKKMMMKRANTIDIPKPIKYINDMESDSEAEDRGINSTKSIGLRGTVQVTVKSKPRTVVPPFTPKTENDLKFLAFIQKQSPGNGLAWNSPNRNQSGNVANNWSNKFGNIKNAFETGAVATTSKPPMPSGQSSARNFWKKTTETNHQYNHPVSHMKQATRQVSSSPKATDKIIRPPWAESYPPESPKIAVPKPVPINKFSHAPMSAFKPISPTSPRREPAEFHPIQYEPKPMLYMNGSHSEPLHNYSAKPMKTIEYPNQPKTNHSPTLPWAARQSSTDHRVQNLAQSKFETKPQRHQSVRVQDQTYQDRMIGYDRIEQKRPSLPNAVEYAIPLQAPPIVQNMMHAAIVKEFPPLTYTSTNYTPAQAVSTYIPDVRVVRPDSLTNPEAEPLVLTSDRPFISPYDINNTESLATSPNVTQNEVSDSEFDTDSITEYRVESKIMKGPVSQQAVTISNRTMRRGDEPNFKAKNSKEAKSLLSVMKCIKPATVIKVTKEGRAYEAPKVESILPTNETVNRFPQEVQSPQPTVQGYNPIYQQPVYKQGTGSVPQSPSQASKTHQPIFNPTRNGVDVEQRRYQSTEDIRRLTYPEHPKTVNISKTVCVGQPDQFQQMSPIYTEPQRSPIYTEPQRGPIYTEPQRSPIYTEPQRSPIYADPQRSPIYAEPQRNPIYAELQTNPQSPQSPKYEPKYEIPPYRGPQITSTAPMHSILQSHLIPNEHSSQENRKQIIKQQKITSHQIIKSEGNLPRTSERRTEVVSTTNVTSPTSPQDDDKPVMVFKKFGPPQPHSYHPNSYQYPLAEQPRKYSEPNIKTSKKTVNQTVTRSTTVSTKFVAPKIVETPSSPRPMGKSEVPSHVIYNNVRSTANYDPNSSVTSTRFPVNSLSKSDSWHQICQQAAPNKASSPQNTSSSSGAGYQLRRVKSGHTLDIPKMYEAGINKAEVTEKQKTVAAYFSGQKSPNSLSRNSSQTNLNESTTTVTVKKTSINRTRTSEKTSIGNQNPSNGLSRSQTMPHIANVHLLDESNVEDAFEELLKSS